MKIACIGNITFDCIVRCNTFIKKGLKNNFYGAEYNTGGPASTAASVMAKYGLDVDFYGRVGNDPNGMITLNQMNSEKIDVSHVNVSDDILTPHSFIIVSEDERTICSVRSKEDRMNPSLKNINYEENYNYILTDGKYPLDTLKLMKKNPTATTIIDAGRTEQKIIDLCKFMDYIICSEEFANEVCGIKINDNMDNIDMIYQKLKDKFPNAKGITITVGSKGYICEKDSKVINMPSYDSGMKAIDTNGAGDIFHGAFTYALAKGYDYHESLEFANVCASLSTTKTGGRNSTPDLEEVEKRLIGKIKTLRKRP